MTVRVTIRTHAVGAAVTTPDGEDRVEARGEKTFNISGTGQISIVEDEPTADVQPAVEAVPNAPLDPNDVPGRAENDALLGRGKSKEARATEG